MAFYIEADTIYITKGDDAVLEISGKKLKLQALQNSGKWVLQALPNSVLSLKKNLWQKQE